MVEAVLTAWLFSRHAVQSLMRAREEVSERVARWQPPREEEGTHTFGEEKAVYGVASKSVELSVGTGIH